jgi:hypothetical protein
MFRTLEDLREETPCSISTVLRSAIRSDCSTSAAVEWIDRVPERLMRPSKGLAFCEGRRN